MKRTSASLIALMSALTVSNAAQAGIADMINSYFTFRHDQKELVAPERTLPPKHIVSPNYNEQKAHEWSSYYTRGDLQPSPHFDGSSMVMRPNAAELSQGRNGRHGQGHGSNMVQNGHANGRGQNAQNLNQNVDPSIGYAGIQRRAHLNSLEKYEGNIYIGDAGQRPYTFNNTGKAGVETIIDDPKRSWRSAPSDRVQPRVGDFDYVKSFDSKQTNNAFGSYTGTQAAQKTGREIARATGYADAENDPLPSENAGYYQGSTQTGQASNLPNNYTVKQHDSLSGISNKDQIYGNWKKWPLIYDANREQIHDPDLIHPGQDLGIPRDYTNTQEKDAIDRAVRKQPPYSFYDGK